MSKKKEIIITIGEEVFRLREGESREITMPILLTMQNGVLSIGYPTKRLSPGSIRRVFGSLQQKKEVPDPEGAPAPTAEELKFGREYEQGKKEGE